MGLARGNMAHQHYCTNVEFAKFVTYYLGHWKVQGFIRQALWLLSQSLFDFSCLSVILFLTLEFFYRLVMNSKEFCALTR